MWVFPPWMLIAHTIFFSFCEIIQGDLIPLEKHEYFKTTQTHPTTQLTYFTVGPAVLNSIYLPISTHDMNCISSSFVLWLTWSKISICSYYYSWINSYNYKCYSKWKSIGRVLYKLACNCGTECTKRMRQSWDCHICNVGMVEAGSSHP